MAAGAALLIGSHAEAGSQETTSLAQLLRRVGEVLLAAEADWRVSRPDAVVGTNPRAAIERELDELGRHGRLALIAASGLIIETREGPALLLAETATGSDDIEALPLRAIAERLRGCSASHVVVVLGACGDGASSRWLDALDTGRRGDLIAVGAGELAEPTLRSLQEALAGDAIDRGTGTVTLRSLGAYLASRVGELALRPSDAPSTLVAPPPLAGAWDPRLTRRSRAPSRRPGTGGSRAPSAEPDDLTGTILPGRFRLDALIARGGFGAVYRARQLSIERDVAVKVLNAELDSSSQSGRLFVNEIQSVGRIDHPNVVRIFQADVTPDGRLFYAMELLAGRDLEQIVASEGLLSMARAVALTRQLLAGLAAAHEAGLVHADVKPANVIVVPARDEAERVVLVDFGLARLRPQDRPARSAGGTPSYMAPEQLRNGRVDARSDVFAAALVLVRLVSGWRRRSIEALVPPLGELTDASLREVLRRALAIEPSARFQSASELADALAGRASEEVVPAAAPTPRHPFPRAAFTELDAGRFLGRDRELAALLDLVLERRVVVLSGPAGCGKSSLLRAGLVPRIGARGARAITWTGGGMVELMRAIDPAGTDLADAIRRCGHRVVVIVDPFEAIPRDNEVLAPLLSTDLPASLDLAVVLSGCGDAYDLLPASAPSFDASEILLGGLELEGARDAIAGALAELRVGIEPELLEALLEDLKRAASGRCDPDRIDPKHLQQVCAVLYDVLPAGEAMLTRSRYDRLGGAGAILGESPRGHAVSAGGRARRRMWWPLAVTLTAAAAAAAVVVVAVAMDQGAAGPPDAPAPTRPAAAPMPPPRPTIVVGGSGTVLWGFLKPVRDDLERRGDLSIPLTENRDTGSRGAIPLLRSSDVDVAGSSARYERELPAELRAAGKLLVEVAIGFDETALFVHRDNPLQRIDVAEFRRVLCCAHGRDTTPSTWSALGMPVAPFSAQQVRWILFGRNSSPRPGDTNSATLAQADAWFCGDAQLCAASEPVEGEAHEILRLLERTPNGLALSSRSFATPAVRRVETIDRGRRTRLNGRKALWLYFAADRARPVPAKLCRFLSAVLDAETGKKLDERGQAEGLPSSSRAGQRSALGLDDGACARRPLSELVGAPEDGIARSPVAHEIEVVERWIPDRP